MRDAYKPPPLIPVLYFLSSLFASATVASFIAELRTRGMSNFEGARGYAAAGQLPAWFLLSLIVFWLGYLWVRQGEARALLATLFVAAMGLPSLVTLLSLLS